MDKRSIRSIASRTGLGTKFLSKDIHLSELLVSLMGKLDARCVLKGGTAIVRGGHLDTARFSEDVDIDVHSLDSERGIADEFKEILSGLDDFDIDPPRVHRMFIRFDVRYENHFDEKDRIKVEIAPKDPMNLTCTNPVVTRLTSPFTGEGHAAHLVYSREDLFAMKIVALSGRQNGKDSFDIRGMWRKGVDEKAVIITLGKLAALDGRDIQSVVAGALDSLEWMSNNTVEIMNITNHYIPKAVRPKWGELFQEVHSIVSRLDIPLP